MSESPKTSQHLALKQLVDAESESDYVIFRHSDLETLDTVSLHVLARAYRTAWRVLYGCEPWGRHAIKSLDLLIEFRQENEMDNTIKQDDVNAAQCGPNVVAISLRRVEGTDGPARRHAALRVAGDLPRGEADARAEARRGNAVMTHRQEQAMLAELRATKAFLVLVILVNCALIAAGILL